MFTSTRTYENPFLFLGKPREKRDMRNFLGIDYSTFGAPMAGRSYQSGSYRYGFNGQEKDDEVTGSTGTSYTAEYWEYDSRLGRRWNVDPVPNADVSNYSVMLNNPIYFTDPDGDEVDKGKFWSKDGIKNRINHVKSWIVSASYRDTYRRYRDDPTGTVYKMREVSDPSVRILQDGGNLVSDGENHYDWQYQKGVEIKMNGNSPSDKNANQDEFDKNKAANRKASWGWSFSASYEPNRGKPPRFHFISFALGNWKEYNFLGQTHEYGANQGGQNRNGSQNYWFRLQWYTRNGNKNFIGIGYHKGGGLVLTPRQYFKILTGI